MKAKANENKDSEDQLLSSRLAIKWNQDRMKKTLLYKLSDFPN